MPNYESPVGVDCQPEPHKPASIRAAVGVGVVLLIGAIVLAISWGISEKGKVSASTARESKSYSPASTTAAEVLASGKAKTVANQPQPASTKVPVQTASVAGTRTYPTSTPQYPRAYPEPMPQVQYAAQPIRADIAAERPPDPYAEAEKAARAAPMTPRSWSSTPESRGGPASALHVERELDDKDAFLERRAPQPPVVATRARASTPYAILTGWPIPATLQTLMDSDLPGGITATVRTSVYDTATGKFLLIPQGSRLVGTYNSHVSYGQQAAQQSWDRIEFPDGSTIDLGGMEGHDPQGRSGLRDKVNNHYRRLLGTALLTSAFFAAGIAAQGRGNGRYPSTGELAASGAATQMTEQGVEITRRNLQIAPTIEIRPGYTFDVFPTRDLLFDAPYSPMKPSR